MKHTGMGAVRRPVGLAAAAALAVGGLSLVTTSSVGAAPAGCTPEFPVGQLSDGSGADPVTAVTGKVTTSGTTPDTITGTYVGTLEDAVGPGKDLLVFKLAGSRITDGNGAVDAGIWAGMSGSPLYADSDDPGSADNLVGAVSYGFSLESSDYAGVTPAADLYAADRPGAGAAAATVRGTLRSTLRADGVSSASLDRGLRRLPIPRAVAGGPSRSRLDGIARKTGFAGQLARAAGGSAVSAAILPLAPGSAVATSVSYGAISYTGVGTVTEVCNGKVYAFGHPDSFTGPSSLSMHGASPVFVQRDDSAGSYVVANVAAPRGRLLQDRASGIVGRIGGTAPLSTVRSRTLVYGSGDRSATSKVSVAEALPFVLDSQATGEVDTVYDGYQQGTADVWWSITGKRSNGSVVRLTRSNRIADRSDIGEIVGSEATSDLITIMDNEFEDVTVTDVALSTRVQPRFHAYRLGTVQAKQRGRWVSVADGRRIKVKPGKRARLRLSLVPQRGSVGSTRTVFTSVKVPKKYRGERLLLQVAGLADSYGGFDDEEWIEEDDFESGLESSEPTTLAGVIAALRTQHRNDEIMTTLTSFGGGDEEDEEEEGGKSTTVRQVVQRAPSVTTGSRVLIVKVTR